MTACKFGTLMIFVSVALGLAACGPAGPRRGGDGPSDPSHEIPMGEISENGTPENETPIGEISENETPENGTPGNETPENEPAAVAAGFDFELETNLVWEIVWQSSKSSNYAGDKSSEHHEGVLRISLGQPKTIAGIQGFAVSASGDIPKNSRATSWKYLANDGGRILGSENGSTWITLFDAVTGVWPEGGFFNTFTKGSLAEATSLGGGRWRAGMSASQDNCEYFSGIGTICGGDMDSNMTRYDYFTAGIGPSGYEDKYSESDWSSGGNWSYSSSASGTLGAFVQIDPWTLGDDSCGGLWLCSCAVGDQSCLQSCWNNASATARVQDLAGTDCIEKTGCSGASCYTKCSAEFAGCMNPRTCAGWTWCAMTSDGDCTSMLDKNAEQKIKALGYCGDNNGWCEDGSCFKECASQWTACMNDW